MRSNFNKALALTLVYEGGYVNDPQDPGGATMRGVTQKVYDAYRRNKGKETQAVRLLSNGELQDIYRSNYWNQANCDQLPLGVDFAVFDYAVHSGVKRAVGDMQRGLGVNVDGVAGDQTIQAAERADSESLVQDLCDRRLAFLRSLRGFPRYGGGWSARVRAVAGAGRGMVTATPADAPTVMDEPPSPLPKAPESDQSLLKTGEGSGLTIGGTGVAGQTLMQAADQVKPHFGDTVIGRLAIAAFVILMIVGGTLVVTSYIKRVKERGGLGGFIGSLGQ